MTSNISLNVVDLELELDWFARVLDARFKSYFDTDSKTAVQNIFEIIPPDLTESESEYAKFLKYYRFSFAERFAILLSLVPHVRPQLLDAFFTKNKTFDRRFTEFGGHFDGESSDFIPTGETLSFILGANNLEIRFGIQTLFDRDHPFSKHQILKLASDRPVRSRMKSPLVLSEEYVSYFTAGQAHRPDFGTNFPARFIETALDWKDLILHPGTRRQIEDIETWIRHGRTLMEDWGMAAKLRPGYRALFYGEPGTGKTMTACMLGKTTGREVYKVDLSLVVSKYIGETEKNLAKIFDQAEHKNWILFFDEADALFGKRSETKDAHDRYANQEVSFLLQRIESFDGIAILSSNLRENMDEAFTRRFESMIFFPMPRPEERLRLWQGGFSAKAELDQTLDLEKISREYKLSGGSIMNIIRFVSLQVLKEGGRKISHEDVIHGIRREFAKEGKGR